MKAQFMVIFVSVILASVDVIAIMISPTSLELSDPALVGEFTLENVEKEAKLFEAAIQKWDQKDNADVFSKTDDVIVLPLQANIQPNKKQKFRVILRKPAPEKTQNTYRLFFKETLQRSSLTQSGLTFLLTISVPIFANGKNLKSSEETKWMLTKLPKNRMGELTLKNTGQKTFVVTKISVSGKSDFNDENMHYFLPGSEYRWPVSLKNIESDDVQVKYVIAGKEQVVTFKAKGQKS